MERFQLRRLCYLLSMVVLIISLFRPYLAIAQLTGWTPQQHVPGYLDDTLPPYLIADTARTVHVFASQGRDKEDTGEAVSYSQWRADTGWTMPIDIILSPFKDQARVMGGFLDSEGVIHLIFFGGDDSGADIYYTTANAAVAGDSHSWRKPLIVGPMAITPNVASIASDGEGTFVVLYSGNLDVGNSLYAVISNDNGETWSDPEQVFSTYSTKEKVFDFSMHLGQSGILHVVWNVTNEQGQNVGGYYAQLSNVYGGEWSEAIELDTNRGLGIAIPAVYEFKGQVFILYNNGLSEVTAPVQWMRRSEDGGKTFTRPVRPFNNHIGRNGHFSFVVDSSEMLHLFFGQRIPGGIDGKLDLHGMWHATWRGGRWEGPLAVVSGAYKDDIDNSFDPYDARAVVSQGNVILITWRTDPGRKQPGVWFASKQLDTPELPVTPLPLVWPTSTATPEPTATEAEVPTLTPTQIIAAASTAGENVRPGQSSGPGQVLIIGAIPVVILLLAAAIWQGRRRRSSYKN